MRILFKAGPEEKMVQLNKLEYANSDRGIDACKLLHRPDIIFLVVRETIREARDVRHQYGY